MRIFYIRAEPVAGDGPAACAYVVAHDEHEALVLLRKDINFSGYRLPPAELVPCTASNEQVRRLLGDAAAHEIGVYGFAVGGTAERQHAGTPPRAS